MSIDPNLLIAAKLIHDECVKNSSCTNCQLRDICGWESAPNDWEIPAPPPEPTERPRIEWMRMLPDRDLINATYKAQNDFTCCLCKVKDANCKVFKKYDGVYCNFGLFD